MSKCLLCGAARPAWDVMGAYCIRCDEIAADAEVDRGLGA